MRRLINRLMLNDIFRFILVGGCSTGIDFIIYMLLSMNVPITISKGTSMITSSVFSYVVNKHFTFENKDKTNIGHLIRYYIVFLANLGTNLGINYLVYKYTGYKICAFILATFGGMTVNYLGQRFFVFQNFKT